jgi:hypothetical protein
MNTTSESHIATNTIVSRPENFAGDDSAHTARRSSWNLWATQIASILRLEAARNFLSSRSILIYLLAALPLFLLLMIALVPPDQRDWGNIAETKTAFAVFYEALILRTVIFFGCAWIFMNLIRGEVVDRSLHYYFLAPVRREVFIIGKYLAGVLVSSVFFVTMTLFALLLAHLPHHAAASLNDFTNGNLAPQSFAYLGTTLLACAAMARSSCSSVYTSATPVIPALLLYGWEWLNFLLPPVLKKVSVIHYMHSLVPVPVGAGPFEVLAAPTPAYLSIPGLLIFIGVVLYLAARRTRRMEILYGGE